VDPALAENVADESFGVLEGRDGDEGISAEVGLDVDWLVVRVADDPDAEARGKAADLGVEEGAELGVLDVVDGADDALGTNDGQASPPGSEMGVIIRPVEKVGDSFLLGRDAKKTAHDDLPRNYLTRITGTHHLFPWKSSLGDQIVSEISDVFPHFS
jgi:hypothetical protein